MTPTVRCATKAGPRAAWARLAVLAACGLLAAGPARGDISGSIAAASDYRFRGVSLSDRNPVVQLDINDDGPAGWYAGGFLSNVRLGYVPKDRLQYLPYGGRAWRLPSGLSLDAGAEVSGFTGDAQLGYLEAHAGLASERWSARLFLSPDYFHSGARSLYLQADAHQPLAPMLRAFVHVGSLQLVSTPHTDPGASRRLFDARIGAALRRESLSAEVSWVATNQVARVYPVGAYDSNTATSRSAWVLQLRCGF